MYIYLSSLMANKITIPALQLQQIVFISYCMFTETLAFNLFL